MILHSPLVALSRWHPNYIRLVTHSPEFCSRHVAKQPRYVGAQSVVEVFTNLEGVRWALRVTPCVTQER